MGRGPAAVGGGRACSTFSAAHGVAARGAGCRCGRSITITQATPRGAPWAGKRMRCEPALSRHRRCSRGDARSRAAAAPRPPHAAAQLLLPACRAAKPLADATKRLWRCAWRLGTSWLERSNAASGGSEQAARRAGRSVLASVSSSLCAGSGAAGQGRPGVRGAVAAQRAGAVVCALVTRSRLAALALPFKAGCVHHPPCCCSCTCCAEGALRATREGRPCARCTRLEHPCAASQLPGRGC